MKADTKDRIIYTDLTNDQGDATGTKVELILPI
jgi:hypothetical protein